MAEMQGSVSGIRSVFVDSVNYVVGDHLREFECDYEIVAFYVGKNGCGEMCDWAKLKLIGFEAFCSVRTVRLKEFEHLRGSKDAN